MSDEFPLPHKLHAQFEAHLSRGDVEPFFGFACMMLDTAARHAEPDTWRNILEGFTDMNTPVGDTFLSVWAALTTDRVEAQRSLREVSLHNHALPAWVAELRNTHVTEASVLSHPLDLSIILCIGLRIGDRDLTAVATFDRGGVSFLTDFELLPGTPSMIVIDALAHEAAATNTPISTEDARATLEEGIRFADQMFPPIDTANWPLMRPVAEWVLRLLPQGGASYPRNEWSGEDADHLIEEFWEVHRRDDHEPASWILQATVHLVLNYGGGNPLHWSPAFVVELMRDLLLRKVMAGPEDYDGYPELLTAFIRFAHARAGIADDLTADVLTTLDNEFPEFLLALQEEENDNSDDVDGPFGPFGGYVQNLLAHTLRDEFAFEVGGYDILATLDAKPLIPSTDLNELPLTAEVQKAFEILDLASPSASALFGDTELAAVMVNLITDAAIMAPGTIRRAKPATVAAAVAWIAAENNGLTGHGGVTQKDITAHFGVSSVFRERADRILEGILPFTREDGEAWFPLGDIRFLTSASRSRMLNILDRYREVFAEDDDAGDDDLF